MRKSMFALLVLVAGALPAHAEGLMGWLQEHSSHPTNGKQAAPADNARLLTMEPGENEMYPQPSPDGKFLLAVVSKGRQTFVSRRYVENGDPANLITDDAHAADSIGWSDAGHVHFLSERAGGLGLWEKISDGEGMQRRLLEMRGLFTQPVLLADGSVIAVRLSSTLRDDQSRRHHGKDDGFDNWSIDGYRGELVRIGADGDIKTLGEGINPSLSPDGQWIVYAMPVGRSFHLFRMHPDGTDLIQVTDARSVDVQPSWSPDGKWIVFTSNRDQADMRRKGGSNWDIWAIDPAGRNLTQLSMDDARDGGARVGPDGRVYFHSDRKVGPEQAAAHNMKRAEQGFHIWTLTLPSAPAAAEQTQP